MGNQNNNVNRERATTWSYVGWLICGGFISVSVTFFWTVILIISIFGVGMATQTMKLAYYLFYGCDYELEENYEAEKTKNVIWAVLAGWFLFLLHKGMYHLCKLIRCNNVAQIWKDSERIVLHPFGVEFE